MLPEQPISFPEFIADQLLTAKNLNDLFHYLDVQERGTRINLIGIGIVCGLDVRVNSAGTEVTITKGCGITSQGYLVRWDEAKFENYIAYDAAKEIVYDRFFSGGKQKFDIDELKSNSSAEGIIKLTKAYLDDKVVLLFVELLAIDAKNCDPESCDDKGKNITLSIKPLLVSKKDAVYLTGGVAGSSNFNQTWISLPELHMPRHHVPAGDIFDSGDVFDSYQKVINASFLGNLEKTLSQTYTRLFPLVKDIYASNPFTGMAANFSFVHNGSITVQQLLYMQYYYDLFSDVIYAYEEMRKSGMKLLSLCCPDEGLFPRHLLLGATGSSISKVKTDYRHYFIPSPAVCCHADLVGEVKMLFKRLVLLLQKFAFDDTVSSAFTNNTIAVINRAASQVPIRITPSKHGCAPLSQKAIPFYYDVASGTDKLFQHWNFERSRNGNADQNLSYHAAQYNSSDEAVLRPLHYDLEPYNFLRIEGHVGQRYTDALATINQIRDTNRLPFDVVALSADIKTLREQLAAIANSTNYGNLREGVQADISLQCHFQDLEAIYDTLAQGLLCNLCKEMKYYYDQPPSKEGAVADLIPQVPLLKKCDPSFRYRRVTLGEQFENFYKVVGSQPYITPDQFFAGNFSTSVNNDRFTTGFLPFLALLYYIEKLSEILPTTLISFNIVAFQRRYSDLMITAQRVKDLYEDSTGTGTGTPNTTELLAVEDFLDHLDALLYACKDAQFNSLYNDYKVRWVYLAMMQKLGYYTKMHPGIQHKAGVTMGGTFILVYHERSRLRQGNPAIFTRNTLTAAAVQNVEGVTVGTNPAGIKENNLKSKDNKDSGNADNAKAEAGAEGAAKAQSGAAEAVAATGFSASYTAVHQLQTSKLKAQLTQRQMSIIDRLFFKDFVVKHTLDELTEQLPDKMVIADFYLPYMCCSDCPPVYFIVNETTDEEPDVPTITIKDQQYCNADKASYAITVSPAGGTVSGEGVSDSNGVFTFNPSAVNIPADGTLSKIVSLTYTKDGQSASVNVTVFAKPQAAFDVIPATTYNFFVFANKTKNAASVTWDFGDGITATGDNPSHAYSQDGVYTVTLKAVNGVCSDTVTKTLNVTRATITIDGKEFCSADKGSYPVKVSPEGGTVTGEGTSKNQDGFVFSPSAVALVATQVSKDILISYNISGQVVQTPIKVFRTPSAAFTVSVVPTATNIRSFKPTDSIPVVQYSWDFGDGKTSVEVSPTHQFEKPGTYQVTLTVQNGPCKDSSSQTITVAATQASVNITPTSFCSADTRVYPITAAPAGGSISGEGASQGESGPAFRPSVVAFTPGQAQKEVTISYNAGQTAQVKVTVFRTPNPAIIDTPVTSSPNTRNFSSNVDFPASYDWKFGDGQTSGEEKPVHTYKESGTYTVSLTVTNGNCPSAPVSKTITIGGVDNPPRTKDCGPLDAIVDGFKGLSKVNASQFKSFVQIFKSYPEVEEYFGKLAGITGDSTAKQLDFFAESNVAALLDRWFTELNPLVQSSDVRLVAIALWRVLNSLAMYIMCIQAGDLKDNKIDLTALFTKLAGFIKGWNEFVANFSKADKAQLSILHDEISAEIARVAKNGEDAVKKSYLSRLNSFVKMLAEYLK